MSSQFLYSYLLILVLKRIVDNDILCGESEFPWSSAWEESKFILPSYKKVLKSSLTAEPFRCPSCLLHF